MLDGGFEIYNRYLQIGTVRTLRLAWTLISNHMYKSIANQMSLLPESREMTPFGEKEFASQTFM